MSLKAHCQKLWTVAPAICGGQFASFSDPVSCLVVVIILFGILILNMQNSVQFVVSFVVPVGVWDGETGGERLAQIKTVK